MPDTYVQNFGGELLLVQIGNGAMPTEVFTALCTINTSRSVDFTAGTSTTELADCTNPSAPSQTARIVKSLDTKFTGAGVCDGASYFQMITWWQSGAAKNCKIMVNRTGAQGGFTATGPYVLTSLQLSGQTHESVTFTCTIEQAQPPTIAANP